MIHYIVNHFSFWCILISVMCLFLFLTGISSHISAYYWPEKKTNEARWDFVNSVLGIACSGFFILIIFTTLNAWSYMNMAREACSQEAASLIGIIRTTDYFPKDTINLEHIVNAAKNYTVIVRTDEWITMRRGEESPRAIKALTTLIQSIKDFRPPENSFNNLYYSQLVNYVRDINDNRHMRLVKTNSVVPLELQGSTTIGCFLLVILLGALCRTHNTMKLLPILFFGIILAFNLVLCVCMSYPFSGLGIKNNMYYSGILNQITDK